MAALGKAAKPHRRGGRSGQVTELALGLVEAVENGVRMAQDLFTRRGDRQPARLAHEQLDAQFLLEPRDVVRDGRLAVVERVCGRCEGASCRYFAKHPQTSDIEHRSKLSAPSTTSLAEWGSREDPVGRETDSPQRFKEDKCPRSPWPR